MDWSEQIPLLYQHNVSESPKPRPLQWNWTIMMGFCYHEKSCHRVFPYPESLIVT